MTVRFPEPAGRVESGLETLWIGYGGPGNAIRYSTLYERSLTVTTAADSGPGSLRETILDANSRCADETPCRIRFAIDEPIRPLTPLPEILGPFVTIEGPATLDGANLIEGNGLSFRAWEWEVSRMVIGNFPESGILAQKGRVGGARFRLLNNSLGVDPAGTAAMPNNRGFVGTVTEGWFTGVDFKDNVIANNGHFGIGLGTGPGTDIYAHVMVNRIMNNGHGGIDIGLDGPTPGEPVPVPRIDRVAFDGQRTVIEGMLPRHIPGAVQAFYSVNLYANGQLDPGGYAEGERYIGAADADLSGHFRFVYHGDLRGLYVNGLTVELNDIHREYFRRRTSEFGQAVTVTEP